MLKYGNMLYVFYGPNSFTKSLELGKLKKQFLDEHGEFSVKTKDAAEVNSTEALGEIAATGLFSQNELIIIRNAQENLELLEKLATKSSELEGSDKIVVAVVGELDKRKTIFKDIKKLSGFKDFAELESRELERWVMGVAEKLKLKLKPQIAAELVHRTRGVQQELWVCLNQLSLLAEDKDIESNDLNIFLPPSADESVFDLLESAISGNSARANTILKELQRLKEDPYRAMGLLASQVGSVLAITLSDSGGNIARDFGIHPYALSQQQKMVSRLNIDKVRAKKIAGILSQCDEKIKTINKVDPWMMMDSALMRIGK